MRKLNSSLLIVLTVGIVTGCGGGDDGDSATQVPTTPLAITQENAQQVAKEVVEAGDDLTDGSEVPSQFVTGVVVEGGGLPGVRALTSKIALDWLEASHTAGIAMGAVFEQQVQCEGGGSASVKLTDNNNNEQPDPGDSIAIAFTNCVDNGTVLNGSMSFEVNKLVGDPEFDFDNWEFGVTAQFNNLSVSENGESYNLDGGLTLNASFLKSESTYSASIAGSRLTFKENEDTARLTNFNFSETLNESAIPGTYTVDYDFAYAGTDIGGSVTVDTVQPFNGLDGSPPDSGKLEIIGANASKAVVEAVGGGQVRIFIDANGNGEFDSSDKLIREGPWEQVFDD